MMLLCSVIASQFSKEFTNSDLIPAGKSGQTKEIKWSVLQDAKQTAILEVTHEPEKIDLLKKPQ